MNKTELVEKIAVGAELSKADAKKALEAAVEAIKTALVEGDKVQLIGFGTFSVNERPAREGMNLRTGEKIQIAAKKVAKFKAGAELTATKPRQNYQQQYTKTTDTTSVVFFCLRIVGFAPNIVIICKINTCMVN